MRISDWSSDVCSSDLLRLAARTRVDQPQPQCCQRQHGARLCRDGDGRGRDAERGARDDAAAGNLRRARHRRARADRRNAQARARMARWLQIARHLVSADLPQIGRAHSELQSLMRISYAVFCLKKKNTTKNHHSEELPTKQPTLANPNSKTTNYTT